MSKKIKSNFVLIIFFLSILHFSNFFYNFYSIIKFNLNERLTETYGYCDNASYGFINMIHKKYHNNKNIKIINPSFSFNNSNWFFYNVDYEFDDNLNILKNEKNNLEKYENSIVQLKINQTNYGKFEILEKNLNCYFLKKND